MSSSDHLLTFQWQSSGDSFPSRRSDSDVEDFHHSTYTDNLKDQALSQLNHAEIKEVAFAVKTNIVFNGKTAQDCPIPDKVVSFKAKEFLHIKEKFNDDWWIGRLVKDGCDIGFIPSPTKLEALRQSQVQKLQVNKALRKPGVVSVEPCATSAELKSKSTPPSSTERDNEIESTNAGSDRTALKEGKKKAFFKRQEFVPPYDVVPSMRPVIFCGPSLKGYEVTDMMQKAIFDFIKRRFKNRISILRVATDISLVKRSILNNSSKRACYDKTVENEVSRIFNIAKSLNLIVLDADTINTPGQLSKSALAPIIVGVKIRNPKVLKRVIMSRAKSQRRSLQAQLSAAQKLNELKQEAFDIILDESQLDDACEHLAEYLEAYWKAVHPHSTHGAHDRLPHNHVH